MLSSALRPLAPAILALAAILALTNTATAQQTATWTGNGNGFAWTDANNWDIAAIPGVGDIAIFDGFTGNVIAPPASVGRISVTNASNVTLQLSQALRLTDTTVCLEVTGGSSLRTAGNFVVATEASVDVLGGSTLTVDGALEAGLLGIAQQTCFFSTDPASTTTINGLRVFIFVLVSTGAFGTHCTLNITDDIVFLAAGVFEAFVNLNGGLGQGAFFDVSLDGDINTGGFQEALLDLVWVNLTIAGSTQVTGGADTLGSNTVGAGNPLIGNLIVPSGSSFIVQDDICSAGRFSFWSIANDGTVDLGNNPIGLAGSLEASAQAAIRNDGNMRIDGDVFGPWIALLIDNEPDGIPDLANLQTQRFEGNVVFNNDVVLLLYDWVAAPGSSVTFNGNLEMLDAVNNIDDANKAVWAAMDDGVNGNGVASISYQGDVILRDARPNSFGIGEGIHRFFSPNIDFSPAAGVVILPQNHPDSDGEIHHTRGSTQNLSFEATTGSYWFVNYTQNGTRIVLDGRMRIVGDMISTSVTSPVVLDATGANASATVGHPTLEVNSAFSMGAGSMEFRVLTVEQYNNGADGTTRHTVTVTGSGRLRCTTLTLQGDTVNNTGAADQNSAEMIVNSSGIVVLQNGNLFIGNGTSANAGYGATLTLTSSSLDGEDGATVDVGAGGNPAGTATEVNAGGKLTLTSSSGSYGNGTSIQARARSSVVVDRSTLSGGGPWSFVTNASTQVLQIVNSTIRGDTLGNLTLTIGGLDVQIARSAFSGYDTNGLQLASANITALSENTFQSGQNGGAHITVNALTNGRTFADSNQFDNSVGIGPAAGNFVAVTAGPSNLTFRTSPEDFGIGGFNVDAATAESDGDNDGTGGTNTEWATAPVLTVSATGTQPGAFVTDGTQAAVIGFRMDPTTGDSTVTGVRVSFSFSGTIAMGNVTSVRVYLDNGDGVFDSATDTQRGSNGAPGASPVTVTVNEVLTNAGGGANYWVVVTVTGSVAGTMTASINANGGIIEAANNIINGLPVSNSISGISGPPTQLVITQQPSNGGPYAQLVNQPIIEMRDANGNLVAANSSSQITASVNSGPGALIGTVTITASNGVFAFGSLTLDQVGTYTLLFTTNTPALNVTSASFDITLTGGTIPNGIPTGGGCVAGLGVGQPLLPWLLLVTLVGLIALRRRV